MSRKPNGDPNYKGNGVILCYNCNKPVRDHRVGQRCDRRPAPADQLREVPPRRKSRRLYG